jgi:hypothetical protein
MSSKAPWGECPRCGFDRRLTEFRKEWTGLRVCKDCYDPKPRDLKPPKYGPEGLPRPDAAPKTEPIFKEDYPIADGEDL